MSLIVVGDAVPNEPVDFKRRLGQFDASLTIRWQRPPGRPGRWVIEQCVEHLAPTAEHTHVCRRIYVWAVVDSDGVPMPLGDHVFQKLASIDTWRQGYAPGPKGRAKWLGERADEDEKSRERRERKMAEAVREASRDNRRQLVHAATLLERHH